MSDKIEPTHFPKDPRGQHDAGEGRDERTKQREERCLRKLDGGVYCVLSQGHVIECVAAATPRPLAPNDFGPAQAGRRGWGR